MLYSLLSLFWFGLYWNTGRQLPLVSWESHGLDCKEIKPFNPKGNQPWIVIGRTGVETPILWVPDDAKKWLIGKDPDAGKDWGQEDKGETEDEMASLTQWTWVWASSGSWWWTGRSGVLQSVGSQRVGQKWVTELNWTDPFFIWQWLMNEKTYPSAQMYIVDNLEICLLWICKLIKTPFLSQTTM